MTGPNGRAQQESTSPSVVPLAPSAMTAVSQFGVKKVKELGAELRRECSMGCSAKDGYGGTAPDGQRIIYERPYNQTGQ